jgi:hypothetical protein
VQRLSKFVLFLRDVIGSSHNHHHRHEAHTKMSSLTVANVQPALRSAAKANEPRRVAAHRGGDIVTRAAGWQSGKEGVAGATSRAVVGRRVLLSATVLLARGAAAAVADEDDNFDYKNYTSGAPAAGGDDTQSDLVKVRETESPSNPDPAVDFFPKSAVMAGLEMAGWAAEAVGSEEAGSVIESAASVAAAGSEASSGSEASP